MRRSNLQVLTGAQCTRVLMGDRYAIGMEYLREGTRHTATATREIVFSGGTVGSTQLLLLSGFEPAQQLHHLSLSKESMSQGEFNYCYGTEHLAINRAEPIHFVYTQSAFRL